MKSLLISFLVTISILLNSQITIHTIGDSTMEQKSEDSISNPKGQRGWPQMLSQFMVNGSSLNNRAKSGTSSKTFYEEKDAYGNYRFWATVKPQIKSGDYVIIQFGHNDEKDGGWQSDHDGITYTGIGTNPWEQYTQYLVRYVNEVRALGANPILFTPIVRNGFSGASMTSTACHNIGKDSIGRDLDYPAAMRKVAQDLNCPLIDHTLLTKTVCEQYGQTKVSQLIYNVGDGTHLGAYGATLYARLAVQELIRKGILVEYLNANPDLLISASSMNFGKCYVNGSSIFQITVGGVDLVPATGNVSVSSPAGFSLSLQQSGTYTQSLVLPYENGNLEVKTIYIKFNPASVGNYNGNIQLAYGSALKTIEVNGECIGLEGGQKASAYWQLTQNQDAVSEGPLTVIPESFSNMVVQRYAVPNATTIWEGGLVGATTLTQRNLIDNATGAWPAGEIDIVNNRFIQFGVTAIAGTTLTIDSVGMYAGGAGGSGMRFKVFVSKDSLFSESVTMIADRGTANTSNTMYPISYNKLIDINAGESLYLRVFPWYSSASTGKTICLYGVMIKGQVNTQTELKALSYEQKLSCWPTQFVDFTCLSFNLSKSSDIQIIVTDLAGKTVKRVRMRQVPAGINKKNLDLSGLSTGIYLCNVQTEEYSDTIKLIRK